MGNELVHNAARPDELRVNVRGCVTMLFVGVAVAAIDAVLREASRIHRSYETDSLVQICSDDVESFFRAPVNWPFTVMLQRPSDLDQTVFRCDLPPGRSG